MSKKYIIEEERLLELIISDLKLTALEDGGVDNWCWYGDSLHDYLVDMDVVADIDYGYEKLAFRFLSSDAKEIKE